MHFIKSYLFWLSQLIRKCYCSSIIMPRTWPRIVRRSQRASMIPIASASAIPWNTRHIYMLLRVRVVVMALQELLLLPSVFAATVSHHITHRRTKGLLTSRVLDYRRINRQTCGIHARRSRVQRHSISANLQTGLAMNKVRVYLVYRDYTK